MVKIEPDVRPIWSSLLEHIRLCIVRLSVGARCKLSKWKYSSWFSKKWNDSFPKKKQKTNKVALKDDSAYYIQWRSFHSSKKCKHAPELNSPNLVEHDFVPFKSFFDEGPQRQHVLLSHCIWCVLFSLWHVTTISVKNYIRHHKKITLTSWLSMCFWWVENLVN